LRMSETRRWRSAPVSLLLSRALGGEYSPLVPAQGARQRTDWTWSPGPETRKNTMKRILPWRPLSRLSLVLLFTMSPFTAGAQSSVDELEDFALDEVTVNDPYYKQLFEVDVDYVMSLDAGRLMAGFRAVSMDQDPATTQGLYGGWEGGWSLLRGHTIGHYLS